MISKSANKDTLVNDKVVIKTVNNMSNQEEIRYFDNVKNVIDSWKSDEMCMTSKDGQWLIPNNDDLVIEHNLTTLGYFIPSKICFGDFMKQLEHNFYWKINRWEFLKNPETNQVELFYGDEEDYEDEIINQGWKIASSDEYPESLVVEAISSIFEDRNHHSRTNEPEFLSQVLKEFGIEEQVRIKMIVNYFDQILHFKTFVHPKEKNN